MKTIKKQTLSLLVLLLLATNRTMAQGNISGIFTSWAQEFQKEIEIFFFIIISIIFLIVMFFALPKFAGESRDIKGGVTNILLFVAGVLVVMGAYTFIKSQSF